MSNDKCPMSNATCRIANAKFQMANVQMVNGHMVNDKWPMSNVRLYVRPRRGRKAASHRLRGKVKARIDCACVHDPRINLSCAIGHLPLSSGYLPNVSLGWVLDIWHWPFAICNLLFAKSNGFFFWTTTHVQCPMAYAKWQIPEWPNG